MLEPTIFDIRRFWSKVDITDGGCWLWTGKTDDWGYGVFPLGSSHVKAHRFAWIVFLGDLPASVMVLHSCDTPACVRPSHLHAGDHQRNMDEMYARGRGRKTRGERHPNAVLTEGDVRTIRSLYPGETITALARRYGVARNTIRFAVDGKTWRHVLDD